MHNPKCRWSLSAGISVHEKQSCVDKPALSCISHLPLHMHLEKCCILPRTNLDAHVGLKMQRHVTHTRRFPLLAMYISPPLPSLPSFPFPLHIQSTSPLPPISFVRTDKRGPCLFWYPTPPTPKFQSPQEDICLLEREFMLRRAQIRFW